MPAIRGKVIPENILRLMPGAERKALGKTGRTVEEIAAETEVKLEKQLHKQISGWLGTREIPFRHDRMDKKTTGTKGWPDFTFAVRGRACAVEVKRPGKALREDQFKLIERLEIAGWQVRVAYSLDDVISFVRGVEAVA